MIVVVNWGDVLHEPNELLNRAAKILTDTTTASSVMQLFRAGGLEKTNFCFALIADVRFS